MTLVASIRCKPCCLSSTQAKRRPSGPVAWNGTAAGRGAKAEGGAGDLGGGERIDWLQLRSRDGGGKDERKQGAEDAACKRGGQISHRCEVLALDRYGLGELRSEIRVWPELTEEGFGQGLCVCGSLRIWCLNLGAAALRLVARKRNRLLGGEAECNEEGGIVDVDLDRLTVRIDWRLERERKVKREQALVVVEGVIHRRLELEQLVVFALEMHEGEIVEILKQLDIHLGKRLKLLFRVDPVLVGIEALDRHGRVELVERPMVTNASDLMIGVEHDLGTDRRPHMRMSCGWWSDNHRHNCAKIRKGSNCSQSFILRVERQQCWLEM